LLTDEKDYSAQAANELLATVDSEEFIDTFNEMKESGELADVKGGQARRLFSRGVQLSVKALRPITKTSWVSALQRARQIFQKIVVPSISELSLDCPGGEILAYTCLAFTRKSPQPPVLKLLPKFAELSQRQWEDVFAEGSNEEIYLAVQLRFDENNLGLLFPASPPAASNNRKDTVLPVTSRRIWHDISGKFDGKNFQSICDCVLAVLMESPALTEDELLSKFEPLLSSFDLTGILEYLLKSGAICAEPITLQQPQSIVYQLNPINFIYKSVAPTAY
jgi:hypothetical protein